VKARGESFVGLSLGLSTVSPGIACVGYTFGLGSIAKLSAAGGWQSFGFIAVAGLAFWALLVGSDRLAGSTGGSVLRAWCRQGPVGMGVAAVVLLALSMAQWSGLSVLTEQMARLLQTALDHIWPALPRSEFVARSGLACGLMACVVACVLPGQRERLLKILLVLTLMLGLGLLGALVLSERPWPSSRFEERQLGHPAHLALVGIALATPTFLVRPWLLGNQVRNVIVRKRDALIGAGAFFALCVLASMVILSIGSDGGNAGALTRRLFVAGDGLAGGCLVVAALAAGFTSILPMIIATPVLVADCRGFAAGLQDGVSISFITIAAFMALGGLGFGERILGWHRWAGQITQFFVPLLVVGGFLRELNGNRTQGRAVGKWLKGGLLLAFVMAVAGAAMSARNLFGGT
jgi:manganese transport protein